MIEFTVTKEEAAILKVRGVDPQLLFGPKDVFDVEESVKAYKPRSPYVKTTAVGEDAQLRHLAMMIDDPYKLAPRITVIGSFPSDLRAKQTALQIFRSAIEESSNKTRKPLRLQIYGDRLDYEKIQDKRPNLLVVTGVNHESTQYKMERLRDVLEMFNDIPRIVVTGGSNNPTDIFLNRLFLPVEMGILVGAEKTVENLLDLFPGL